MSPKRTHKANISAELTADDFQSVSTWVTKIEKLCVPVSEDWLEKYVEAIPVTREPTGSGGRKAPSDSPVEPVAALHIPRPPGMVKQLKSRREQLANFEKKKVGLRSLLVKCNSGKVTSQRFYEKLPSFWGFEQKCNPSLKFGR